MTAMYQSAGSRPAPVLHAGRLWAGGLATAVVAGLIAIVGILVGRGLFGVAVLAPKGAGTWGGANTVWYALGAALLSLAATGLMHGLILFTPRPMRFFGWIMVLATAVGMTAPFATAESWGSVVYTAGLNMVLGIAIGSLVSGTAHAATRTLRVGRS